MAVAVAAECGVELVDVEDGAGVGEVFVEDGVDEGFGGGFVGCWADGVCVEVAGEEIGGFELAFVFSAGGDEEMFGVWGADA